MIYECSACNLRWHSYTVFVRHAVNEHGVSRPSLQRRLSQAPEGRAALVRSGRGSWFILVQGRLL